MLLQDYENYEHIVVDGQSTDQTISILKNFPHLNWHSEPDSGQSEALNKGFSMATGDIIAWINSDDWYEPGVFTLVNDYFETNRDANVLMGNCNRTNALGEPFDTVFNYSRGIMGLRRYWNLHSIPTQPAIFFRRKLLDEFGLLDESLHYAMDYDLWLRFAEKNWFHHVPYTFANYRIHPAAKGGNEDWTEFHREWAKVYKRRIGPMQRLADLPLRVLSKIRLTAARIKKVG